MKIDVYYIHLTKGIGGGTTCLYNTILHLDKNKFIPHVICCTFNEYISKISKLGANIITVNKETKYLGISHILSLLLEEIPFAIKLIFILGKSKRAIVHLNNDISLHSGSIIGAYLSRKPIICTMRGSIGEYISPCSVFLSRYVDTYIAVSEFTKNRDIINKISYRNILTIYDGLLTDSIKRSYDICSKNAQIRIGTVGNIHAHKGYDVLVGAAKRVLEIYPNIEFHIAGKIIDENCYNALKLSINLHHVDSNIKFLGFIDNVSNFLSSIDIFVCPSSQEAFGMVIIEAMVMGLPVIAAAQGGPAEIISDGIDGLLIPPENPDLLAGAIIKLVKSASLRKELGENASKTVTNQFNINDTISKLEDLYINTFRNRFH